MSNDNSNSNENVRDIYLQNESYIDYYFDKYDMLSDNECIIDNKEIGNSYCKELDYIYKQEYRWICDLNPYYLCNCEISATRGVLA